MQSVNYDRRDIGNTLHDAVKTGVLFFVKLKTINSSVSSLDRASKIDADGYTVLDLAVLVGVPDVLDYLLRFAPVNLKNGRGNTALQTAVENNLPLSIIKLLRAGADPSIRDTTLLHMAVLWNDEELVSQLFDEFNLLDPNAQCAGSLFTPLHLAMSLGSWDIAEYLMDNGVNPNVRDRTKTTPLHMAARAGKKYLVNKLLEDGVNLFAEDITLHTPSGGILSLLQNKLIMETKKANLSNIYDRLKMVEKRVRITYETECDQRDLACRSALHERLGAASDMHMFSPETLDMILAKNPSRDAALLPEGEISRRVQDAFHSLFE
jgi:ankyrin repeat protein